MTEDNSSRRPRFFWHGMLLLLPVLLLGGVGLFSLRRDARLAEQEIRDRAAWLAEKTHTLLGPFIQTNLDLYLAHCALLQRETNGLVEFWCEQLVSLTNRAAAGQPANRVPSPDANATSRLIGGTAADRWPAGDHLAFHHQFLLQDSGLVHLPPAPPSSLKDTEALVLSDQELRRPATTQLFQRAEELEYQAAQVPEAIRAYAQILDAEPSHPESILVHYILGVLEMRRGRTQLASAHWEQVRQSHGARLPGSGIPVRPLALLQLARLRSDEKPPLIFRDLCRAILEETSPITPLLLEKAEALLSPEKNAERALLESCRNKWDLDQRTRALGEAVRASLGPGPWTNQWRWMDRNKERFLVGIEFAREQAMGQDGAWNPQTNGLSAAPQPMEGARTPTFGYRITVLPKRAITWAAQDALSNQWTGLRLPAGLALSLDWDGEPVPSLAVVGGAERSSPAPWLLATQQAPVSTDVHTPHELTVRIHALDTAALSAPLRLRRQLYGALIACAALTALAGFLWTRRAFRRQLQLNEMKTNFVSSVSHELRAPIASVQLLSESLDRGKVTEPAKQRDYFRLIAQECRRLSALVENVLDFARIEQGRKEYEFGPTDLVALVQHTARLMEPYAAEKQVPLLVRFGTADHSSLPCEISADGRALQQALVNLVDNAIKHSRPGQTVTIHLDVWGLAGSGLGGQTAPAKTPHGRSVLMLSVVDNGPGIPAEERQRIFERFYRRGSELRRETLGIGIGLNIVQHIVRAHGGEVTVESEVGQGSRFTLVLPVEGEEIQKNHEADQ